MKLQQNKVRLRKQACVHIYLQKDVTFIWWLCTAIYSHIKKKTYGCELSFYIYCAFYAIFRVLSLARTIYFFGIADIAAALAFSVSL